MEEFAQLFALEKAINDEFDEQIEATASAVDWENLYTDFRPPKLRRIARSRDRGYALTEMQHLNPAEFKKMFRLSRETFFWLLSKLDLDNKSFLDQARFISASTKLAVTLRFLAGGSYLDICFAFGIASGTFFKAGGILWGTIEEINKFLEIGLPLNDLSKLEEISEGFSKFCIMAMDGWVCKIKQPSKSEGIRNIMCYRNRKGVWGLVVFAGCDDKCRFTFVASNCPGSTNDCLAWRLSYMKQLVDEGRVPEKYFFICDEALACSETVLVPYGGNGIGADKDSFNFHLSVMRQCIERAFGLLVKRWGIFWRPLMVRRARCTLIIEVCAKLHNLCLDRDGTPADTVIETVPEDHGLGDDDTPIFNTVSEDNDGYIGAHGCSMRRMAITEDLKRLGYRRPVHSKFSKS